ncbi:MAG: alpha-isopropylmalate synthase regulatory domain-containing protein, partial [Planctomycetia bacterium]|nr:alpha-isopropylmalate synthase regulatory domain-containing protein [Planctomycetia bacterium]
SINGLGERAGNCSLEEVVMGLNVRPDSFGGMTDIKTQYLYPTSRLVSRVTGMVVQRNKAIVGENAFAHESGIHQDGVLKHRQTFEIMRAEDVGFKKNVLVLGKHSGRHAFRERLKELGFRLNAEQIDAMFIQFKNLADRKKEIFDADLEALVESEVTAIRETWRLRRLQVASGTGGIPMATVELENTSNGKIFCDAATGDGPVDAIFQAIERLTHIELTLQDYQLRSVTGGTEAQGEARVEVVHGTATVSGRGVSTDILEASAKAYLNAINRIISRKAKPKTRAAAVKKKKKSRSKKR